MTTQLLKTNNSLNGNIDNEYAATIINDYEVVENTDGIVN